MKHFSVSKNCLKPAYISATILIPNKAPNNVKSTLGRTKKVTANTASQSVLQKYWFTAALLILALASFASIYIGLFAAFVFTLLVPGLVFYRFFSLKTYEIWAFVPIFSVLFSVELIYYLSLAFGYSRDIIISSFLAMTALYAFVVFKKGESLTMPKFLKLRQIKKTSLAVFAIIFLISLIVLVRSVWFTNQSGIVLTGSNWQDTPLHYEIIETINNGNFPPQMPDYAGVPMTYHYFVDFHTAILEKMYGYLPTLLPVLNAVFILVFALAIYALARPSGRRAAIIATVVATFGWGLSYYLLFSSFFNGSFTASTNYIYQYQKTFGLPSIFDNLLQQRPLLMGLPAFALVLALLRNMDDKRRILLAGVVTGLVFQFHNVAFFCCYVAFAAALLFNYRRGKTSFLYFLVPTALALPFIFSGGPPLTFAFNPAFLLTFVQNPLIYYFLNLGIPFLIAIISLFQRGNELLKGTFLFIFLIPNILLLTPNPWDMYKFFIFAWVPIAVLTGIVLAKRRKIIIVTVVLFCILTSTSVITYNLGTNFLGADKTEYQLGLWVRDNTPQQSVFLTYSGTIQSPPGFIGGRLLVSSYVNWPYGWGVPLGDVEQRASQVDKAYNGNATDLALSVNLYNVSYVYVGKDELYNYPGCTARLDSVSWLTVVFSIQDGNQNLRIYQVNSTAISR